MADPSEGAPLSPIRILASDKRIDRVFLRRVVALVLPYWWRRGGWLAWLLLAYNISLGTVMALLGGYNTYVVEKQTNALAGGHAATFWYFTFIVVAIFIGSALLGYTGQAAIEYLKIDWRRVMTTQLVQSYLAHRTYYDIAIDGDIDNPDQRIQEETVNVCDTLLQLPLSLLGLTLAVSVQVVMLNRIAPLMTVALFTYLGLRFIATIFLYRPGIGIAWDRKIAEAELRYGILHVRDNAETIAFYQGERAEQAQIGYRMRRVVRQMIRNMNYEVFFVQTGLNLFQMVNMALPWLFVIPLYFSGKISFGAIAAAAVATQAIEMELGRLSMLIPQVTNIIPNIVRLSQIMEKSAVSPRREETGSGQPGATLITTMRGGDDIRLRHVSYQTPGGERLLGNNLSLHLRPGDRLIITGRTGVGKSSLLRVLAGLWTRGTGTLEAPLLARTLIMPQRPYMVLGTLRSQLLYPAADAAIKDAQLLEALRRARLPDLVTHHGGLDVERDWARILSLGEQQRIGFARFLIQRPDYVFLDEATSAVDLDTEAHLYGMLVESGATIVSIAHRTSVLRFHTLLLDLHEDQWSLHPIVSGATDAPASPHSQEIQA